MIPAASNYTVPIMHTDHTSAIHTILIITAFAIGFVILCVVCLSEVSMGRKIYNIIVSSFVIVVVAAAAFQAFTSMPTSAYINTSSLKKSSGAVLISSLSPDHDRIILRKNELNHVTYVKDGVMNDGIILIENGKAGLFDAGSGKSGKTAMKPVLNSNHHDNTPVKRTKLQEKDGVYNIPFDDIARVNHVSNLIPLAPDAATSVYPRNGDQYFEVKYVKGTSMYDGMILIIDGHASLYQLSGKGTQLTPVLNQ